MRRRFEERRHRHPEGISDLRERMERQVPPAFEPLRVLKGGPECARERFLRVPPGLPELGDPTSHIGDEALGVLAGHLAKVARYAGEEYKLLDLYFARVKLRGNP
jgi:hypothetical protein